MLYYARLPDDGWYDSRFSFFSSLHNSLINMFLCSVIVTEEEILVVSKHISPKSKLGDDLSSFVRGGKRIAIRFKHIRTVTRTDPLVAELDYTIVDEAEKRKRKSVIASSRTAVSKSSRGTDSEPVDHLVSSGGSAGDSSALLTLSSGGGLIHIIHAIFFETERSL